MRIEADVAVVGAGPAGLSSALYLAAEGLRVAVVEQSRFPRTKACGEGLMPSGLPALRDLGLLHQVAAEAREFRGVRFVAAGGAAAEGRFPDDRRGLILARERLDHLLLEKAKATPGIEVLEGRRVVGITRGAGDLFRLTAETAGARDVEETVEIAARRLLAADGVRSLTARLLGTVRRHAGRRRFGLRARFVGVEGLADVVEVFLMPGYEIYLAPHAGKRGEALIALLLDEAGLTAFAGRTPEAFHAALEACGPLRGRIRRAERGTPILGLGPLGGSADRWEGPGWLLVGDAASSLDPITGEGIALALLNGRLAAFRTAASLNSNARNPFFGAYTRERRKLLWKKRFLETFLLCISRNGFLADAVLRTLSRRPSVFRALMSEC